MRKFIRCHLKKHGISALIVSLFLIVTFSSCGQAEQDKYEDMTGANVTMYGDWQSDPVTFTDRYDETFTNTKILLSFSEDELVIKKGKYVSKAHPYTRNGVTLSIMNPEDIGGFDMYYPFPLEFNGNTFKTDLSALNFLKGITSVRFTKIADEPSLTAATEDQQHKHDWEPVLEVAADCENPGNVFYYICSSCEQKTLDPFASDIEYATDEDVIIPALEHLLETEITREAEYCDRNSTPGLRIQKCMREGCNYSSGEEEYYLDHEIDPVQKDMIAPTCENYGYEPYYECNRCKGKFLSPDETGYSDEYSLRISPTGHSWAFSDSGEGYYHNIYCLNENCDYKGTNFPGNHEYDTDMKHCKFCGAEETYQVMLHNCLWANYDTEASYYHGPLPEYFAAPEYDCAGEYTDSDYDTYEKSDLIISLAEDPFTEHADTKDIKGIFIPDSYIIIEKDTFTAFSSLTDIYFEGSQEEWNKIKIKNLRKSSTSIIEYTIGEYGIKGILGNQVERENEITVHFNFPREQFYSEIRWQ